MPFGSIEQLNIPRRNHLIRQQDKLQQQIKNLTQPNNFDNNMLVVSNMPTDKHTPSITEGDLKSCLIKTDQSCTMTPPVPNRTNNQNSHLTPLVQTSIPKSKKS